MTNEGRGLVTGVVVLIMVVAGILAFVGLTDRTIFANVYATLSVMAMVGAVVVLKLYEVFRE